MVQRPHATSRQEEESHVVGRWLFHLQRHLGHSGAPDFVNALQFAGVRAEEFEERRNLSQAKLDIVLRCIQRAHPDIIPRMYKSVNLIDLGLVGYAALSSGTIGKALEIVRRYFEVTSDTHHFSVEVIESKAVIRPVPFVSHIEDYVLIAEDCLCGIWRVLVNATGSEAQLQDCSVEFDYPEPSYGEAYRNFFDRNVAFEVGQTALIVPATLLERPIATANIDLAEMSESICERVLGESTADGNTAEAVRRLLVSRMGKQMLKLEDTAEELRLSATQLRKRLYRAGTSYKKEVLEIRMAMARHYLDATHLTVQEIANLLDYSSPSAFSRAFKEYYGVPPVEHQVLGASSL